jgi:hypothetical protein
VPNKNRTHPKPSPQKPKGKRKVDERARVFQAPQKERNHARNTKRSKKRCEWSLFGDALVNWPSILILPESSDDARGLLVHYSSQSQVRDGAGWRPSMMEFCESEYVVV